MYIYIHTHTYTHTHTRTHTHTHTIHKCVREPRFGDPLLKKMQRTTKL